MEIWKPVAGYEDHYEVSNHGRVRSKAGRTLVCKNGVKRKWKQRYLGGKTKAGYVRATLYLQGECKKIFVHRLVAEAFLPKVAGKEYINHKDGNKASNHYKNIKWATLAENNRHAIETGLNKVRHSVALIHKKSGKRYEFKSKSAASTFMGHSRNYITELIQKGKMENEQYKVIL